MFHFLLYHSNVSFQMCHCQFFFLQIIRFPISGELLYKIWHILRIFNDQFIEDSSHWWLHRLEEARKRFHFIFRSTYWTEVLRIDILSGICFGARMLSAGINQSRKSIVYARKKGLLPCIVCQLSNLEQPGSFSFIDNGLWQYVIRIIRSSHATCEIESLWCAAKTCTNNL